jgi:hypothetical protein
MQNHSSDRTRSSDSRLTVMREAATQGHAEIALMILNGSVRVYTRSPKSRPGWQITDWDKPFPKETAGVVFLDTYSGPPKFFVTAISEARKLVADQKRDAPSPRPVTAGARHTCITPEQVAEYQNAWEFYRPDRANVA